MQIWGWTLSVYVGECKMRDVNAMTQRGGEAGGGDTMGDHRGRRYRRGVTMMDHYNEPQGDAIAGRRYDVPLSLSQ